MTPPLSLYHALLRPAILQILRATGYHGAKTAVLDSLTDLAARYLFRLCEVTALYAAHNGSEDLTPDIVDVRMALQHAGALLPERPELEQEFSGIEDLRGLEIFLEWAEQALNKEIKRIALDGNDEANDYLDALKKKHSKTDDDSKFLGTLLGRPNEHGDILVEGGQYTSISSWEQTLRKANESTPEPREPEGDTQSRPQSSGLSSLGDRTIGDEMDFS
ncbi:hypothetical protein GQ53DRAFT_702730 [Thozetella sp. PMI_491]|nr:hypothetical protein GQ53DRAFT_702730 [Thozetella sp. PMI_491]